MNIKFNRFLAIFFLALGLVNLFLNGWLLVLGEFKFSLLLGVLLTVIGVRYLTAPYFRVDATEVVVPTLLGPIKRTYVIRGENGIRVLEGKTLEVYNGREWEKVTVQKWMSDGGDWQALIHQISVRSKG